MVQVNGADLTYVEQGAGAAVIFVHGAWMDLRYWEPQREAVAAQHRYIAYDCRYHGTAPWPDQGELYSVANHAADLAAFMRRMDAGPAHLVTLSSGGIFGALAHRRRSRHSAVLGPDRPGGRAVHS